MIAYDMRMTQYPENLHHNYVFTNKITLHVVQTGPENGPLLLLLHGFPEYWMGWRHQITFFASLGFRVWIPDQRGYNLSDKPVGVAAYNLDELAADVIGLIDAAGEERAYIVGHDWGGAVAWWAANKYPERVQKLGILNVPHHAVFNRRLRNNLSQLRRSWYILFFQLPWLPELLFRAGNWTLGVQLMKKSARKTTFLESDLEMYKGAWAKPGAISAMINWYRAIFRVPPNRLTSPKITVPTLLVWGAGDIAFDPETAPDSIKLCEKGRLVVIEDATHWVQHDSAAQVNHLLADFLKEPAE